MPSHRIGLLLGDEDDWPRAFEAVVERLGGIDVDGVRHDLSSERLLVEPFDLRRPARHDLVIDRIRHWYDHPREWVKKAALLDGTYLLNNPFTFQAMEKHAAYAGLLRLGFDVPRTWLLPPKDPVDDHRFATTAARYNAAFDLDAIADDLGPGDLYMKPFDGGGWVGVSKVTTRDELHAAYDASGTRLMHLQEGVDFDVFSRSLSIGPQTTVMRYDPSQPLHQRYTVDHDFLDSRVGEEVVTTAKVVDAFFDWEFNSCEVLVQGDRARPIDYANATPDVSLISLHYYFPWAIRALVAWSAFVLATDRDMLLGFHPEPWFEIADDPDLSWTDRLAAYRRLADQRLAADEFAEFSARHLGPLDQCVHDFFAGPDGDALVVDTVRATFPAHEHEQWVAHYRGLVGAWVADQG